MLIKKINEGQLTHLNHLNPSKAAKFNACPSPISLMQQQLGFPYQWIFWIHNMVFQDNSQIVINGLLGKIIILKRSEIR
jgi:hypothetical protein